jgi:hypothetical protein
VTGDGDGDGEGEAEAVSAEREVTLNEASKRILEIKDGRIDGA